MTTTPDTSALRHVLKTEQHLYVHTMGRALRVSAIFGDAGSANAHMARHDEQALVACFGPFCLTADKHDKGDPLHAPRVVAERDTLRFALAESERKREALAVALARLSDWMRERTGPADGTPYMLTQARAALAANAGGAE